MNNSYVNDFVVWAADVGSIKQGRFGYYGTDPDGQPMGEGTDIREFVTHVIDDLRHHRRVALGFECPLVIPISTDPIALTAGRKGDGNRAWSAGAGSGALATGLVESTWVFERLAEAIPRLRVTLQWEHFAEGRAELFLWEAFVTAKAKGSDHSEDARIAVKGFCEWARNPRPSDVSVDHAFSLVGAALLRAGLTNDLNVLREPCLVVKVLPHRVYLH